MKGKTDGDATQAVFSKEDLTFFSAYRVGSLRQQVTEAMRAALIAGQIGRAHV